MTDGLYPKLPENISYIHNNKSITQYQCHDYCGCPETNDTIYVITGINSIRDADVSKIGICMSNKPMEDRNTMI